MLKIEKVLDSGIQRIFLANVDSQIQRQVFSEPNSLKRQKNDQKKKDQLIRQSCSDYSAFLQKAKAVDNRFPSIFSVIKLNTHKPDMKNMEIIQNISFPLIGLKTTDLIEISCRIIRKGSFAELFSAEDMKNVIRKISEGYNTVSYHNFSHGVSLMHLLSNCYETDKSLKNIFTEEERGYSLIAALAHDINHPGYNNGYQNKTNSQLSQITLKDGVLEKMHTRHLFQILKSDKKYELDNKIKQPLLIKEMITRIILSTDISKHFTNLNKLKKIINNKQLNLKNYDHRYFILQNLFHACDIGNPCLHFKQYINWAALVSYEFNHQSEMEAKSNFQISPYFAYRGKKQFYKGQTGFINGLVYPLWKQLSASWPGLNKFVENISINLVKLKIQEDSSSTENTQQLFIAL